MNRIRLMSMMLLALAFTLVLTGVSLANANEGNHISTSDLIASVAKFDQDGQFTNQSAARALSIHLTAVNHFERQGATDKVIEHMNSFKLLLDHQLNQELISEIAHYSLMESTNALIKQADSLVIVQNGQARAVVVIPEAADEEIIHSASELVEYVKKSTGAELPFLSPSNLTEDSDVRIYIGMSIAEDESYIETELEGLDNQSFLIYPHENRITIIGPSIWGTKYGVYDFIEEFVGVRWLAPGPDGEDVPELTDIIVPREMIKEEPAFPYRLISPARNHPGEENRNQLLNEWAQRNKLQGVYNRPVESQENIHSLFPVEKYGETNPEFYPNGNPPAPGDQTGWQPCYSNEATIDAAVSGIIQYFDENPDASSFSVGVNDGGGYCESSPSHPHYPGKFNSIGIVDMSDIYYEWVNAVVEQVAEVYPDKWFGLLAYQNVMDPPSFPLHPRIVPFITKDRLAWIDEDIRAEGLQQMEDWNAVASQVGWYDYMYGEVYQLPRVYPHLIGDIFRYADQYNSMGSYVEMYHTGGDGPKAWLAAKLQWDPNLDVDALMDEWYERTVGPEAAPHLAAAYDIWEEFWTERIKKSGWFEAGKTKTYLNFPDQSYLDLVTDEDIEETMRLMSHVVNEAKTAPQRKRAELLYMAFEFYEASALSFPREIDPVLDEADALSLMDQIEVSIERRLDLLQKRRDLYEAFKEDPILTHRVTRDRWYEWSVWNPFEFWYLVDYVKDHEKNGGPVTDRINDWVETYEEDSVLYPFVQLLKDTIFIPTSKTANPSFEIGSGNATSWSKWIAGNGSIRRSTDISYSGQASVVIDGMERGGPVQTFDLNPGLTAAQFRYYSPPGTEAGTVQINLHAKGEGSRNLASFRSIAKELSDTAGEWATVQLLDIIPDSVNGEEISRAQIVITIDGAQDTQVYVDDAVVYQVSDGRMVNPQTFWELVNYIKEHEPNGGPIYQDVVDLAESFEPSEEREYAKLLLSVLHDEPTMPTNGSFEAGGANATSWSKNIPESGTISRTEELARTGNASLLVKNMSRGGPIQTFDVKPGLTAAQIHYYTPADTESGTITFFLNARNAQFQNQLRISAATVELSETAGEWATIDLAGEIPAVVNGHEITMAQIVIAIFDGQDTEVYIDDVEVFQHEISQDPILAANAVKTSAGKEQILQSLDFSTGPWTVAEPFDQFLVMNRDEEPPVQTNVRLLWDDENLYVGYENFDDNMDAMIVDTEEQNGWWVSGTNDSVETYVTANPSEAFFGFFTNPNAVKFTRYDRSQVVNPEWQASAQIGTDRWNVIQVIPFAEIGVDPTQTKNLAGFFFRNYHGASVYLGWDGGAPWTPADFKPVRLIEK